ncbi:MAG: hypothetical protein II979_04410 [Clostridia bacterium]|nr:hypothetical protein [Clostridia bacterium]
MQKTIATVKRFVNDKEVSREELLAHKISNPVLDRLYQTAIQRSTSHRVQEKVKKSS